MASIPSDGLRAGETFAGRYRIRGFLGEGDRKRTYLADDTVFARRVALALIKPSAAGTDPGGTWREAEALAKAGTSENIVTLHDAGTCEGTDYLVFAYLPGGTLREYLAKRAQRGKPLSAEEVMLLGRRLARALAHVHGLGLIHRDVAPANIWLDERQMAHLGDFDSVISLDAARRPSGLPPTTEAYAPPEQLNGNPLDERSDLYSLGAVLYEALTGEQPERHLPRAAIARRLTDARHGLPRNLLDTVCSLLAESPGERPASAEQVLDALKLPPAYRNAGEGLGAWADTLPFPLASILWHYDGEPDASIKVDYLLKFFEALAQFTATVLLSACLTDRELANANLAAWFAGNRGPGLQRATFGAWVELAERLAVTLRELLEIEGGTERLSQLFRAKNLELANALTSAELTGILRHAWDRRNNWSGHGGVAGQHVHRERLRDLEDLLTRTQALLGWAFGPWTLLKPGPMTRSGKVFDLTATILKGPNSAFRRQQLQLDEALDTSLLYLVEAGSRTALELVPFIRLLAAAPGQDACYFYNRMEGTAVRWVSYHHHQDPELLLPDDCIADLLADLTGPGTAAGASQPICQPGDDQL